MGREVSDTRIPLPLTMHIGTPSAILILGCAIVLADGKGLYSGVPCHRPYKCVFDEDFANSVLVDSVDGVSEERTCQDLCQALYIYAW